MTIRCDVSGVTWKEGDSEVRCPYYTKWKVLFRRCGKMIGYEDVSICQEWQSFSKFREWMESQPWEGKELDKDLFGDGKQYSPESCVFLTPRVNKMIKRPTPGMKLLPGVSFRDDKKIRKFQARVSDDGKRRSLGYFLAETEAHRAWQVAKSSILRCAAEDSEEPRVRGALIKMALKIEEDIINEEYTLHFKRV